MKDNTKKLLIALGVTEKTIEKLEAENSDINVDDVAKDIKDNQAKLLKNDAEFIDSIKAAEKGKNFDEFERYMKKTFGLTAEEIKDKKFDEIIKIAKDKANSGSNQTLTDLQNENIQLKNKVTELETVEIPKVRAEIDEHKKKFNVNNAITKKLAELKLRNPIEVVLRHLEVEFGSAYDIDLDDKGNLLVKDKKTKLEVRNSDGTKLLTADDIIKENLSKNKFLEESGADESGKKVNAKPDPIKKDEKKEESIVYAPGLNKAEEALAKMREKSGTK